MIQCTVASCGAECVHLKLTSRYELSITQVKAPTFMPNHEEQDNFCDDMHDNPQCINSMGDFYVSRLVTVTVERIRKVIEVNQVTNFTTIDLKIINNYFQGK